MPKKKAKKAAKTAASTAKTERPQRATSRAKGRPQRHRSIAQFRDMMNVENKDPEFRYRWVLGATENDKRLVFAQRAGWEFVDATKEADLVIGDYAVGRSERLGSIYRIPATRHGREEYLYLMRMPEKFAREVDDWKQEEINKTEEALTADRRPDDNEMGQYGGTRVDHEFRVRVPK